VINFQGVQGWLVAYLLDISGDLGSVPVVPTPPTPTPGVTATPAIPPTPTPTPTADVIIDSVVAVPTPIAPNQTFTINVTVRNIGGTSAGTFAVAGTFAPNNLYLIGQVPSLGPGQSAVLPLSGTLSGSGTFTTSLVIDANNQVPEGVVGEQNNIYNFTYTVGQSILNQGMATLNLGDTVDLEGNAVQGDANWNADDGTLGLKAIFGAKLGVLGSGDYNAVTWEQINPSVVNRDSIPRTEINPGTLIGIITADGHRGVMQVNTVSDTQIVLTYKVYNG
jgi:hypothetical protein